MSKAADTADIGKESSHVDEKEPDTLPNADIPVLTSDRPTRPMCPAAMRRFRDSR